MATMSVSGVASGMDWDSMIDEIITNAAKPAQVQVSKKNNLTNKKSLFEEMKVTMNSLQSSLSPLKLPSTYKAKQIDIERIDTSGSYKGVLTATVNADAEVNVYDLVVNQLARAQTNRSKQITAANIGSALSSQGLTSGTMYINMMGQKVGIDVDSSDSLQTLKSKINSIVKTLDIPIDVTASVVDNRLVLRSNNTGLGANTMTETLTYGLNGTNTITSYNVSDADLKAGNFVIRSGGTTYTYGKDYDLVNGNEIRWNQYEDTDNVKLGDSVTATYKIAKGDIYQSTGTYGSNEASITGLTVDKDNSTLSSRLRIVDDDGYTYTYGTDFTLDDSGNVEWIEEKEATTSEPSSYTVSYTSTETVSSTISSTKGVTTTTTTNEPDSYIVRYDDKAQGSYEVTHNKSSGLFDNINLNFDELSELYKNTTENDLTLLPVTHSSGKTSYIIDPSDRSAFTITSGGTTYEYGVDFVVRTADNSTDTSSSNWQIVWAGGTILTDYESAKGGISGTAQPTPSSATSMTFSMSYDYDYTRTARVNASDNDKLLTTVFGSDFDMANFDKDKHKLTIRGYRYDTDFKVDSDGEIVWLDQTVTANSVDDAIISDDFDALTEAYNKVYDTTEIPTVNLTDSNGVLRTYLDPADSSLFTMTSGDTTYEYGKDYVIRVNDARNGYTISWAITNDVNSDGSKDINDADTVVTTYTKYKDLSTYDMKEAPANGETYSLTFSDEVTTTKTSDTVKSTQTDKSLATILPGVSIDSSDYSSITITSGSTTYTYGTDFTIDDDGNIEWLYSSSDDEIPVHPDEDTAYTLIYEPYSGITSSLKYEDEDTQEVSLTVSSGEGNIGGTKLSYEQILSDMVDDADTGIVSSFTYNDKDTQEAVLTVSSGSGNIDGIKLSYEQILSDADLTTSSSDTEIAAEFAKNFSLTDEDGNEYVYGTDYKIISGSDEDASSGEHSPVIEWLSVPASGTGFTLSYTGRDTKSTDSLGDSEFAKYFSLTDEDGTEYEYGTDYRIIRGSDTDSSSGEHSPLIEWLSVPMNGTGFNLVYTGRSEATLDIDVTRSNTDAIMAGTSGASPLYSYFDGGTSTITSGTKTFYEGIDYEITSYETTDDNGKTVKNAAVEWKTGTNSEWYYPGSNAGYTINLTTSSGNSMSFSGVRSSQENINLSTYGFTSVNGSISSVSFTGDDGTYTYDLTSTDTDDDGNTSTQNMRDEIGLAVTNGSAGGGMFYFNWVTPARTANADLPSLGAEITAEYTYQANTFTLSDDSDGSLLSALELDQTDETHYTAAQNAELVLDGETITRDSNDIGEAYENELIKGMTIHLKGVGEVSLDVSHDAEKAVESIQTFVDTYNDLMTWMNTRMTEKQVDKDTAATIDSDDFRMRWGLLHGNSLLRNTKAKMRSLTSQNFTFSFTQRSSAEEIYGTMGYNGLRNDATLRLRINSKFVDVSILPTDTLQDIIDKINDDSEDGPMHDIYYDDEGKKLTQPLIKATIENDKLVITSTNNDSITMSGTSAMNALKMNYTYKGLFQLGIASTATDYGKSGELEFDTSKFMEALEDNADEVQELMLMFANDFDSWTKSMLNTSASGETSGTLTREIENLDNQINTINEYLEKYQERLDRQEESLRTRYASSETQFAKLSQQANSIAAILNQLNGYANNNNSSSSS